jgi:hypothetical protein
MDIKFVWMHGWGPASPGSLQTWEIAGRRSRWEDCGVEAATRVAAGGHREAAGGGALREEECAAAYAGGGGQLLLPLLPLPPRAEDGWLREEELGPAGA